MINWRRYLEETTIHARGAALRSSLVAMGVWAHGKAMEQWIYTNGDMGYKSASRSPASFLSHMCYFRELLPLPGQSTDSHNFGCRGMRGLDFGWLASHCFLYCTLCLFSVVPQVDGSMCAINEAYVPCVYRVNLQ